MPINAVILDVFPTHAVLFIWSKSILPSLYVCRPHVFLPCKNCHTVIVFDEPLPCILAFYSAHFCFGVSSRLHFYILRNQLSRAISKSQLSDGCPLSSRDVFSCSNLMQTCQYEIFISFFFFEACRSPTGHEEKRCF